MPMPLVRSNGFRADLLDNPARLHPPFTYAVWDGEAVKVGTSKGHPRVRLDDLQTGNPRKLVLLAYTARPTEREAHKRLQRHRLRGEWFRPDPQVLAELRTWDWLDTCAMKEVGRPAAYRGPGAQLKSEGEP